MMKLFLYRKTCLVSIIFVVFFITSCVASTTIFTPNELPNAKIGIPYNVTVDIGGGPGPVLPESFRYTIAPSNSGIFLDQNKSSLFPYNTIIIYGNPKVVQPITITIMGFTSGTSIPGHSFNKAFTIRVEK